MNKDYIIERLLYNTISIREGTRLNLMLRTTLAILLLVFIKQKKGIRK